MPTIDLKERAQNPAGAPPKKDNTYLYHQQEAETKPRDNRRASSTRRPKPKPESQAGQRYFLSNLKTFGYVGIGMMVIIVLAWLIAQQMYRSHLRKNKSAIEEYQVQLDKQRKKSALPEELRTDKSGTAGDEAAIRKEPINLENVRKAMYLHDLGRVRMKEQNYEAAVKRFQEALELNPYLYRAWADLGYVYLEMKDAARAQVALEKAVEGDPTNPEVLSNLGLAYLNVEQHEKAKELFEQAMAADPSYPKSHFYLAKSYIRQRDFDQAIISLERYLRMEPSDASALRDRAYIEAQRKQYNQAMDNLKKAIAERPDWPELYWDAAACSALLGRAEDAIRYLEKGEAFTNPSDAFKAWQAPAFEQLRGSAPGKIYEKELADRVRRTLQNQL
jgi:Flp pilus assembly protein TadD